MSIQDERELRDRLGGLLDSVDATPAPVARAMRRGKVIRMRRWVAAAAGVAVIAAGAVVLPRLLQGNGVVAPTAPQHYKVTVDDLGPTAKNGLIASGTINGKRWRVVLNKPMGDGCSPMPYLLICGPQYRAAAGARDVNLNSTDANGNSAQFQIGSVGPDVARVVIRLSNGTDLDLRPVTAFGQRWVAAEVPWDSIIEAESFVGNTEYQQAIPYVHNGFEEFVAWLRPGQVGLSRASAQVGWGRVDGVAWQASVSVGPWGYCTEVAGGGDCTDGIQRPAIGKPLDQFACAPLYKGTSNKSVGAASIVVLPAGVKNLELKFADGSRLRLVATLVAGTRAVGFGLANRPKVVRALEYGFAGQLVGSTSADWSCGQ